MLTPFYRILNKNSGYFWIQTCCTMVCQTKNMSDQTVICVNYIITRPEKENLILDISQMPNVNHNDYHIGSKSVAAAAAKRAAAAASMEYEMEVKDKYGELAGSQSDAYLDGHVDHKELIDKSPHKTMGLGMFDKKESLDFKDKHMDREKGCSNSKVSINVVKSCSD